MVVIKSRVCQYCGIILSLCDTPNRRQCRGCSMTRIKRWYELMAEAKRKLDSEWPKRE